MKKTYSTPAVVLNGDAVRETKTADIGLAESVGFKRNAGELGFNL